MSWSIDSVGVERNDSPNLVISVEIKARDDDRDVTYVKLETRYSHYMTDIM